MTVYNIRYILKTVKNYKFIRKNLEINLPNNMDQFTQLNQEITSNLLKSMRTDKQTFFVNKALLNSAANLRVLSETLDQTMNKSVKMLLDYLSIDPVSLLKPHQQNAILEEETKSFKNEQND